jgi:intracellular sulfur oxidation DsrE/DsrF family protein
MPADLARSPRRTFLGRLGALLAAGASPAVLGASLAPAPARGGVAGESRLAPDERWLLAAAQKEHRLFIETGTIGEVVALRRAMNFLDAYKRDYGIDEGALGLIIGFHGNAIALALGDALWARHRLGERNGVKGADGQPATANPFRRGAPFALESLKARGVTLLACNNSLRRVAGMLVPAGGDAAAMHASLVAGVEGMQVVPAMAIAVSRAQERGIPYLSQD